MVEVQYSIASNEDLMVNFTEPTSMRAVHELKSMRGVHYVEPFQGLVPVRLKLRPQELSAPQCRGLKADAKLHKVLSRELKPMELPDEGVMLTDHLAKILAYVRGRCL